MRSEKFMGLTLRSLVMPYGMSRDPETGFWTVFGREYDPLIEGIAFDRLGRQTLIALQFDGKNPGDTVWFYNDGCTPESSPAAMKAYLERMRLLMKLRASRGFAHD